MASPLMELNGCCFYFNLRTGTLYFLWSILVSCTIITFYGIWAFRSLFISSQPIQLQQESFYAPFWLYFLLIFGILPYAVSLYGVYKKKRCYVKYGVLLNVTAITSWVITILIFLFLLTFSEMARKTVMINRARYEEADFVEVGTVMYRCIVLLVIITAFNWYSTSVIYSYYLQMKRAKNYGVAALRNT